MVQRSNEDRMARYESMLARGIEKLEKGTVPLFPGFSPKLYDDFVAVAMLPVHDRLVGVFENLARVTPDNVGAFLIAGRDFPLHLTIQQVRGLGYRPAPQVPDIEFDAIRFDRLIVDPGCTVLMTATVEPLWLQSARSGFEATAADMDYQTDDLFIVHASLARVMMTPQYLTRFIDFISAWDASFRADPITVMPEGIYTGSVGKLLGAPTE